MKVYIPCFFNNILERELRFYKCLEQYLNLNYEIVIYWMNKEGIKIKNKNLTIINEEKGNASYARNKLLSMFYSSKDAFGIFSDDDTLLKERVIPDKYCESYTNDFYEHTTLTEKISSSFIILKNIRPKIFFDESLEANQDLDFGKSLRVNGFDTYRTSTKKVEIYKGNSSMFNNGADKLYKKQQSLRQIQKKYENIRDSK